MVSQQCNMTPDTRSPPIPVTESHELENGCIFWTEGRAKAVERATEALVEVVICGESFPWEEGMKDTLAITNFLKKMLNEHMPMCKSSMNMKYAGADEGSGRRAA